MNKIDQTEELAYSNTTVPHTKVSFLKFFKTRKRRLISPKHITSTKPLTMLYRLKFPTLKMLSAFVPTIGSSYKVVNHRTLVIVCECSPELIDLAKQKFRAEVMEIQP